MFPADAVAIATTPHSELLTQLLTAAVGCIVAITAAVNHRKGQSRDRTRKSDFQQLQETIAANHRETTEKFGVVELELRDLRGFVVGPDGENGIRGDVRGLKTQVEGLIERERERLEVKAYDRRRSQG